MKELARVETFLVPVMLNLWKWYMLSYPLPHPVRRYLPLHPVDVNALRGVQTRKNQCHHHWLDVDPQNPECPTMPAPQTHTHIMARGAIHRAMSLP